MFFDTCGFHCTHADSNLYILYVDDAIAVLIILYVDDLIITGSLSLLIDEVKHQLSTQFEMTDLGILHYYLGMEVWHSNSYIFISQMKYVKSLLSKYKMEDSKTSSFPLLPHAKLSKHDDTPKFEDSTKYRQLIGSLWHLTHTRPDISHAVGTLSQFSNDPHVSHWKECLRILKYVAGTSDYGISYTYDLSLYGFSDADWAESVDDRRSITGYGFIFGNGLVSWLSKKQSAVSGSTTEAEYKAYYSTTSEALWLISLMKDLKVEIQSPLTIYSDSQSAIAVAKNPVHHSKMKHIDVSYHFTREQINNGVIQIIFCGTKDNVADMFTKALNGKQLKEILSKCGVGPPPWT